MTDRERIESYIPIAKFIAATYGPRCEVVLHHLDDVDHSIVHIENGYITNRSVGDGLMDFVLGETFSHDTQDKPFVVNLAGKLPQSGRKLRFSTFYIRNDQGELIGFLGITIDITDLGVMKSFIDAESALVESSELKPENGSQRMFALSAHDMLDTVFQDALLKIGSDTAEEMSKQEKMQIIDLLNEHNLFSIKGMISIVAKKLALSVPSVYRLLREIKDNNAAK